jgi:hypothetical protein
MLEKVSGNAPLSVAAYNLVLIRGVCQELAMRCDGYVRGRRRGRCDSPGKREQQTSCAKLFHGFSGRCSEAMRLVTGREQRETFKAMAKMFP